MKLRQEVWVFLGVVLILGWLLWGRLSKDPAPRTRTRADALEMLRTAVPDIAITQPGDGDERRVARALFEPPTDTRPLAPLGFEEPPREPLAALAPPPLPGPRARHFAPHLTRVAARIETPDLFAGAGAAPGFGGVDVVDSIGVPATAEGAGTLVGMASAGLGAADRSVLEEGYRRLHDWIELVPGRPLFGRIANADRFALRQPSHADTPIRFEELDPATGAPRYPGQKPIEFERARIAAFGLADTPDNRLEIEFRALDGNIGPANLATALDLAERCLDAAFEVPRALAIAKTLLEQSAAQMPDEPAPLLGLARRHELAFEIERALALYDELASRFAHRADVHLARARLEARLLLDEEAEASFRLALARDTGYRPRLALGEFLISRGRTAAALELLEPAVRSAPQGADERDERLALRLALGAALAAEGRLADAFDQHLVAWRGSPDSQRALAGMVALAPFAPQAAAAVTLPGWLRGESDEEAPTLGFELLLASGARAQREGNPAAARDAFQRALDADPLRAAHALVHLCALADTHGYPDEALAFAERALEADPSNPWALFQRARLVLERGDLDGAEADLARALAIEADFADALAWRGEVDWRRANFADAELYLERAVGLVPERADWIELRALCLVQLGAFLDAADAAADALAIAPDRFAARAVAAWCVYRLEGAPQAIVRFGELEDSLRALPEDAPPRVYTRAQLARLDEHRRKVAWSDAFERSTLANQWTQEDASGPLVRLEDGALVVGGTFTRAGDARVWREYPAEEFQSLELDLFVEPTSAARVGVFAGRESGRAGPRQIQAQVAIARNRDGATQTRVVRGSTGADEWLDSPSAEFPAGRWVRVRIERSGEGAEAILAVALDGIPVLEGVRVPGLGRATTPLRIGVFAEGDTGRPVTFLVDNVEVVRRLAP